MDTPRVAIATGVYRNPRGTQVNFHVDNLFGGNTVVLSAGRGEQHENGPAQFVYGGAKGFSHFPERLSNVIRHRTDKVPRGEIRQNLIAFLREKQVNVILSEFGNIAPRIAPIARDAGIPMFTYFRGIDASAHLRNPLRLSSYRKVMPHLAGVFSVSRFLLENLASVGVIHPNSFVVPSGVDTSLFLPVAKKPLRCLAVGRLIEKKRPDITIRAFMSATRNLPDAVLDVVGEGPLEAECRSIINASGMAQKVVLHGAQSHSFVREKLSEAEVFLQHSVTGADGDTEGLPTSIQEAMSCGAIVVSTRHAGIPEAVSDGETGYLVEEGDEAAYAACISKALTMSVAEKQAFAKKSREFALDHLDNRKLIQLVEQKILELSK